MRVCQINERTGVTPRHLRSLGVSGVARRDSQGSPVRHGSLTSQNSSASQNSRQLYAHVDGSKTSLREDQSMAHVGPFYGPGLPTRYVEVWHHFELADDFISGISIHHSYLLLLVCSPSMASNSLLSHPAYSTQISSTSLVTAVVSPLAPNCQSEIPKPYMLVVDIGIEIGKSLFGPGSLAPGMLLDDYQVVSREEILLRKSDRQNFLSYNLGEPTSFNFLISLTIPEVYICIYIIYYIYIYIYIY
ncbi:unnamed protein product [Protopolystoma xenopodis]|uniref:Uncharacterized protein n=1 Tax=Protopolystoma xenopodis TaxID=117903 RepID=A0A448WET6_9PLAT|nr:unnamed protein product [Protopolystoma xenopodis]